jgi:hypothetical protein
MIRSERNWLILRLQLVTGANIRLLRASAAWSLPALTGVAVAAAERFAGGELAPRVIADGWEITAAGVIAIRSFSQNEMAPVVRQLLLASVLVAAVFVSHFSAGMTLMRWDWLYLSGILVWIIGVELSESMEELLNDTLRSLADSGVILATNRKMRSIRRQVRRSRRSRERQAAVIVGTAVLLGWLTYGSTFLPVLLTYNSGAVVFETVAAIVAGQRLGRMVNYASAWRLVRPRIRLMPGHPDGVCGLKMAGRFYFRQAAIAGLPAVYLALWWLLIPLFPDYARWRDIYLALLAPAIAFEILTFFVPMRAIHVIMLAERRRRGSEADRLMPLVKRAQETLLQTTDGDARDSVGKELEILLDRYQKLCALPSWPIDASIRRWFTLNNAALFIPFLSYIFGNQQLWQQVGVLVGGLGHLRASRLAST